jgi:hypothetical protein
VCVPQIGIEVSTETKKGVTFLSWDAEGGTRTRMPRGATPSRWCVCQFHHFGCLRNYLDLSVAGALGAASLPAGAASLFAGAASLFAGVSAGGAGVWPG